MKVSLVIQIITFFGTLVASNSYQQRNTNDNAWVVQFDNRPSGSYDPLAWSQSIRKTQLWQNPMSKPQWQLNSKPQWQNPKSKLQWHDPKSKFQWRDPKSKSQWRDPLSEAKWRKMKPNRPSIRPTLNSQGQTSSSQRPSICDNPPTFIANVCIPCICNPNYNSRDWPDYIPPVRFFKPSLDEPPAF